MKKYLLLVLSLVFLVGCGNGEVKPSTSDEEDVDGSNDPWTHIEVNETVEYEDLTFTVNKVVVSNEIDYNGEKRKAIGTKWINTNNSKEETYKSYISLGTLITSDGEQVKVEDIQVVDGQFAPGVSKEGNVTFLLNDSDVENLEWIKIVWNVADSDLNLKELEMTINLK